MGRQGSRKTIGSGIYEDDHGLAAVVNVGSGPGRLTRERRYPKGTTLRTIRAWQEETRVELRKMAGRVSSGTLADDVPAYLARIRKTLASYRDRERDVRAWLPRFGQRRRASLTTRELDAQLAHWRNTDGLSASAVNHRRDALSDLFAKLDGPEAHNPVKGCIWFPRPKAKPQAIDRARILRVLSALEDRGKTKWRLLLMHWTGMRPSQMARLSPTGEDFYLDERAFAVEVGGQVRAIPAVLVPSGKGGEPVMFPLLEEGVAVARGFLRTRAFGRWSCPSAYKRIVEAAKKVGEPPFNVYRIKHSFASALRRTGTDLADIQDMLGHADPASTRVYAPAVRAKHLAALERLRADDTRQYDGDTEAARMAPADGTEDHAA